MKAKCAKIYRNIWPFTLSKSTTWKHSPLFIFGWRHKGMERRRQKYALKKKTVTLMRKQGSRKPVPEWRCKPDDTHTRASNMQHTRAEGTRREGRLTTGFMLFAFQAKQRPPVTTYGHEEHSCLPKTPHTPPLPRPGHPDRSTKNEDYKPNLWLLRFLMCPCTL